MASSIDDKDLDDPNLWAAIDSAAASFSTTTTSTTSIDTSTATTSAAKCLTPLARKSPKFLSPPLMNKHQSRFTSSPSPSTTPSPLLQKSSSKASRFCSPQDPQKDAAPQYATPKSATRKVQDNSYINHHQEQLPRKISRIACVSEVKEISPLPPASVMRHVQPSRSPIYSSPDTPGGLTVREVNSYEENLQIECWRGGKENEVPRPMVGGVTGRFPTVSVYKEYQEAAMSILEKSDYLMISGNPYIKKSGWRKLAFYFNVSFEIKDKNLEFDEIRNVQRAEFTVRAHMMGGRYSDGWGSCERREKKFMKPNHDIPSTAETRAKNKACQDLLGIGQFRPSRPR